MKKVTIWYQHVYNEDNEFLRKNLNHLEDGWVNDSYPKPLREEFTNQRAWANEKWDKVHRHINDDSKIVNLYS